MMKPYTTFLATILCLALMAFTTVPNTNAGEPADARKVKATENVKKDAGEELARLFKEIPSEFELAEALKKIDASYIESLAVPVANVDSYLTREKQQLMVGVYFFDFCYAAAFAKKKKSEEYWYVLIELFDKKLHYETRIPERLKKIDTELEEMNEEKLRQEIQDQINTLGEIFTKTDEDYDFLVNSLVGAFTEAIYVVAELTAQSNYNQDFLKIVADQKNRVNLTFRVLELFKGEIKSVDNYLAKLTPVRAVFEAGAIKNKSQVDAIRNAITPLRKEIIE